MTKYEQIKMIQSMSIEQEMKFLHQSQMENKVPNPLNYKFPGDGISIVTQSFNTFLICTTRFTDLDYPLDHCYLRMLYIIPSERGKGIGREIITLLIKRCKLLNFNAIEVESENESYNFFVKMGFKKIEDEVNNRMRLNF